MDFTTEQRSQIQGAEASYRTLLELATAIDKQTSVQAVLQSLHKLLSAILHFDGVAMMLLTEDRRSLRLVAFERGSAGPHVDLGAEAPYAATAAGRAIEEQRTIYVPDIRQEMSGFPQTASQASTSDLRSAYMVPVFTPRKKLGVLWFGTRVEGEAGADDIALMEAVASHLATALESAMASDAADSYQRQLVAERDRWKLLLDINNHVTAFLDVRALFRAACSSLREYFNNDFAAIWLIDKDQNRLQAVALDFPTSQGFLDDITLPELTADEIHRMRTRQPELWTRAEIQLLPAPVRDSFLAEGTESIVITALRAANRPLGVITLGSKRPDHFRPDDLDLMGQIATQISLALDNALAYERLNASRDQIEEERLYLESEIRAEYNFEDIVGKERGTSQSPTANRNCRAYGFDGAVAWRNGNRKGVDCARDPQPTAPGRTARSFA